MRDHRVRQAEEREVIGGGCFGRFELGEARAEVAELKVGCRVERCSSVLACGSTELLSTELIKPCRTASAEVTGFVDTECAD